MITFIIVAIVAVLAIAFSIMAWKSGARKRSGQSGVGAEPRAVPSAKPEIGRAAGPD
jgi:hypothetical protein